MYLCTYTFSALCIRRKDMVKKTILVYLLRYTHIFWLQYIFVCILVAVHICMYLYIQEQCFELNLVDDNIRVCKTNLPNQEMSDVFLCSSILLQGEQQRGELMTKIHECAVKIFFSRQSLSQTTTTIEYWAVACWRTSQTK